MSLKFFHADFAHNIFRQQIIYPYQSQSASSFDLEKVPIPDVNDLSSMSRACTSCRSSPVRRCLEERLEVLRAFPQSASVHKTKHGDISSASQRRQIEVA